MKKRIVALLLCCVMLLTLSPNLIATAVAEDDAVPTVEEQVKEPVEEPKDETKDETVEEPKDETKDEEQDEIVAEDEAYTALLNKLLATESMDAFKAVVKSLSDEEVAALEVWLTDTGRYAELEAHCADLAALLPPPETRVFTDAGPFMPAVTVTPSVPAVRRVQGTSTQANDTKGIVLNKSVKANGKGMYTITLESYTTGTVTTVTKTTPVDIVLVLDQSGSMADNFGNTTRQKAMQTAVKSFIEEVSKKYSTEADHRMAIVTFGSSASTLQDWTYVDASGKNTLQSKINGLPNSPSGATNAGAGMQQAETLMGRGYNYTGTNTSRQKVVIFFTDGVPTTGTAFDTSVADTAIAAAKRMKESGVTVYSVGIFNGANPEELYGASGFDRNSDGTPGSDWSDFSFWMIGDIKSYDVPAGNRFLNYVSSNFKNASEIGIKNFSKTFFGIGYYGWEITKNFDRQSDKYYLTAEDSTSLNNIFQTISENIQTSDISLDSKTVIKDIIADSFELPNGADPSSIKVYTANATAASLTSDTWGNRVESGLKATVSGRTVTVTGFDFNANFVSKTKKSDGTFGKKLIIEFTVKLRDGFLGGNNVPTNGVDSGVYDKDGKEVKKFDVPAVNIPIEEVNVTAQDKNVYLLGSVTAEQLQSGATVKVGNVELKLGKPDYGLADWQTAYVDITVTVKDKDNTVISDRLEDLKEDTTYTIEVTVKPKKDAAPTSSGAEATAKTGKNDPAANIYVFKPELTFKDSIAYYGETVPTNNNYSSNLDTEKWMHNGKEAVPSEMLGEKNPPTLNITYTPDANKLAGGKYTKQDVPVKATVKIGSDDVTTHTTFLHKDCNPACGWENPATPGDPAFLIHIQTCTLSITKQGGADNESYVFDVFKDGVKYSEVTVWGNGTETLVELPVGTYTISENQGWSWRYSVNNGGSVELKAGHSSDSITCVNTLENNKWLNGFSTVVRNIFGVPKQ